MLLALPLYETIPVGKTIITQSDLWLLREGYRQRGTGQLLGVIGTFEPPSAEMVMFTCPESSNCSLKLVTFIDANNNAILAKRS